MKLALVVGSKTGESLKPRLMSLKDNLEIDVFEDVPYFIDITYKRNIIYNRILITSTLLDEKIIRDIHTFWSDFSKDSQIVVLGKQGRDDNLVRTFMTTFQSTMMGSLLVPSTNVRIIAEACFQPVQDLNEQYGISDFLQVSYDTDNMEVPEPEEDDFAEEPDIEPQIQPQQVKKNGGIMSALMGNRTQPVQPQQQPVQDDGFYQETPVDDFQDDGFYEETPNGDFQDDGFYNGDGNGFQQEDSFGDFQGGYNGDQFSDGSIEQNYTDEYPENEQYGFQDGSEYPEQDAFYNEEQNPNQYEEFNNQDTAPNFTEDPSYEGQGFTDGAVDTQQYEEFQQEAEPTFDNNLGGGTTAPNMQGSGLSQPNNSDSVFDTDNTDDGTFEPVQQPQKPRRVQNPQINNQRTRNNQSAEINEDFGSMPSPIQQNAGHVQPQKRQPSVIDEINEDLSNINLGMSEQRYKQAKEQPKVIVQEVVRNVGAVSGLYDAVKKGAIHKTIVVTGDRCTGVTLTALNIAKTLSANTSVLYVDFDNINHGSLTYLDYSIISDFEQIHLKGTKVCKNSQIFKNCTISYDRNLDLLLSDYSETVTTEDIVDCARVLAERALDYTVVVIDCPLYNINALSDILVGAMPVVCVEGTKRGFMNMICSLDNANLEERIKRLIVSKSEMLITKCSAADAKKWLEYMKKVYQPDGMDINWMNMRPSAFNGKLNEKLMNRILEG